VPLARKFDRGVQGVSEVASAHSRPEQRVNNVNFVIEVDGVGYFGGDDPHSARSRSPAAARVARSRRATIREAEKIAHDRLHDFRIRFALERLSRVAVFELGPRASWPSWRTNRVTKRQHCFIRRIRAFLSGCHAGFELKAPLTGKASSH